MVHIKEIRKDLSFRISNLFNYIIKYNFWRKFWAYFEYKIWSTDDVRNFEKFTKLRFQLLRTWYLKKGVSLYSQ